MLLISLNGMVWTIPSMSRSRTVRSEEHTSELQSRQYLVCRLLLEKKKIVQVPLRVPYYMKEVGNEPWLRFEFTRGVVLPSYPAESRADFVAFFFNDTATTEIYTLSLHDALPI